MERLRVPSCFQIDDAFNIVTDGVSKAMKTSVKSLKPNQLIREESRGFNFSSKLVKVTEEEKREKPKRTRNWKGRKAAERAKREAACRQDEIDREKSHQALNTRGCFDCCGIIIEESIAELLTSLGCPADIEYYLKPMPLVNLFEEFSRLQSLEAQNTGKVYSSKNCGLRPSSCFDILREKIEEARELNMEECELLEKIDKLMRKIRKSEN